MGQENCKPQPGDLIEIYRSRRVHWALYVGDGYVINLTPAGKQDLKVGVHTVPLFIRKVKKQLLKEVVQNHICRVNNKYDHSYTPLPVVEIIRRAERFNDREFKTVGLVETLRALLCGEMHVLDMTEDTDYPSPGHLIEVKQSGYQHWALYLWKGHVIHMTAIGGDTSLPASSGLVFLRKAIVKKELLEVVARNDKWLVNNKYDRSRTPFPVEEIIRCAEPWIGKEEPYHLFRKNCEHFVTMLRYGDGVSEQAKTLRQNFNSISSVVMAGIGVGSLIAAAGIPVVGLPLVASVSFAAAGSGSLLASIGFISSNIVHSLTFAQFEKAGRDILETTCC